MYKKVMTPDDRIDSATRARMAAKDMLRGLRHEFERLKSARPVSNLLPPRPADALNGLFETVDRIATAGEHLARDLLFSGRDQSRYADFFDPRSALVADPDAGHRFVRSRYAALKLAITYFTGHATLISESKIAAALADLPTEANDNAVQFETQFTIALVSHQPITLSNQNDETLIELNRLGALVIGLAGVVAAREDGRDGRDLPELIALSSDIVSLRKTRLIPVFDGPAPDVILAPILDELAGALIGF